MSTDEKKHHIKVTNIILLIIVLIATVYIAQIQGWINLGSTAEVTLVEGPELISLDMKEKNYIGVNNKQIYKVTAHGINAYDFDGQEIWSDTLSLTEVVVKQKTPYIAVASKRGKSVSIYSHKGKQAEITLENPLVYFSINREGSVVTIEEEEESYTVSAYEKSGKFICSRTSYVSSEGYPVVAELAPNNERLLISYINTDEPQVNSTLKGMVATDNKEEIKDNTKYGVKQKDNLVYAIEFINTHTWVSIGDKKITWYDLDFNEIASVSNINCVFTPYLTQMSQYETGYLPLIATQKPSQNLVHREDEVIYFNEKGEQTFSMKLNEGAEGYYADENGIIYKSGGYFKGYNRLGNSIFSYKPRIDISKVIYIPGLKKGIAVNKEKVILLEPKKEGR